MTDDPLAVKPPQRLSFGNLAPAAAPQAPANPAADPLADFQTAAQTPAPTTPDAPVPLAQPDPSLVSPQAAAAANVDPLATLPLNFAEGSGIDPQPVVAPTALEQRQVQPAAAEAVDATGQPVATPSREFEGPSILDTEVGKMLSPTLDTASPVSLLQSYEALGTDEDALEAMVGQIAADNAAREMKRRGIGTDSRYYNSNYNTLLDRFKDKATAEFTVALANTKRQAAKLDELTTPEGEVQQTAAEHAGFFGEMASFFGGGIAGGLAGTADLANAGYSVATRQEDIQASGFLRDVSTELGDLSDDARNNQTARYARQQEQLESIFNSDERIGTKLVRGAVSMFDTEGLDYIAANVMYGAGWTLSSLLGGGAVGAVGKVAAKGTTKLAGKRAVAAVSQNAAAATVAKAMTSGTAKRLSFGAKIAAPLGASSGREVYDQIDAALTTRPEAVRGMPGWKAAQRSLQLELGREPEPTEVDDRFKARVFASTAGVVGAAALVGTVVAPATEGMLLNSVARITGNRIAGTTIGSSPSIAGPLAARALGGTREAVAEGFEEYVQTVAGETALRVQGAGQSLAQGLEATADSDAQLAAFVGAVVGGAGGAVAARPADPRKAASGVASAGDASGKVSAPDAAAAPQAEQDSPEVQSLNALSEAVAEGAEIAQQTLRSFLRADHDVEVTDAARFGLGDAHGPFTETDPTARVFEPFFSDRGIALGVNRETGQLGYGAVEDGIVVWYTDASRVEGAQDIADAADAIQITVAASQAGEFDVELASLYGRRIDREGVRSAVAPVDPLAVPDIDLSVPEDVRAEQEQEEQLRADARTAELAMGQLRGGAFPGLMTLAEDAVLSDRDAADYVGVTRVRLEERYNWYTSLLAAKPRLATHIVARLDSLPRNVKQSKAVARLLNAVHEAPTDAERTRVATRAAFSSTSTKGERAAASELLRMLSAKDLINRTLWTTKGTERKLSVGAAATTVADVANADPLAATVVPAVRQGTFTTLDAQSVAAPAIDQLQAEANVPLASASPDAVASVANAVQVEGAGLYTLTHAQRRDVGVFKTPQKAQTREVVRKILNQRLQLRGEYTRSLSRKARENPAASELTPEQEQSITTSMNTMLTAYAARRAAEGVATDVVLFEMMHVGGITRVDAEQHIEKARQVDPRDAALVDSRARSAYAESVRRAVGDQVYSDPVPEAQIGEYVRALNASFRARGVRFQYFNTEEEYISAAFDEPVPAVGTAASFKPGRGDAPARVSFVRNRIKDKAELERIAAHEIAVHYGLRNILSEEGIAQVGAQIIRSDDKSIRNLVNATRREIIKARVSASRQDYTANGMPVPANLQERVTREIESDPNYEAMLGEEVLATALERGIGDSDIERGPAVRVLESMRQALTGDTDLVIRDVNDLASLVASARNASGGLTVDGLNPNYDAARGVVRPGGHSLNVLQRAYQTVFNEEAPLLRLALTARQILGRTDAADRLDASVERGSGRHRALREQMRSRHLTPMYDKLEATRQKLGMDKAQFYPRVDQYLYLKHSDERIEWLVRMHGKLARPENEARRNQILAQVRSGNTTDAEFELLRAEMRAMQDPNLDAINRRDPEFGAHLVGRTFGEIDLAMDRLRAEGFAAEIEALDLHNPETGDLRLLTDAILDRRRESTYGESGYGMTKLMGWKFYVPMADYEGPKNANDEPDLIRIGQSDALTPGAWHTKAVDGRYSIPKANIFSQLVNTTDTVARDVVVNDLHRAIADTALREQTTGVEGDTRLGVDPRMEWLLEDDVQTDVTFSDVGRVVGSMALKYDRDAVKIAWNPDGTATVYAVKDVSTRNALNVRQTDPLTENSALWMKPIKALRSGTRAFGTLLTAWNPAFVLTRQLPRDLAQGMIQAGFEQNLGVGGSVAVARKTVALLPEMQRYFLATPTQRQEMLDAWRSDEGHQMHTFALRADLGGVTFFEQQLLDPTEDAAPALVRSNGGLISRIAGVGGEAVANTRRVVESLSNSADNAVRQALADSIYEAEVAKIPETGRTKEDILVEANEIATSMLNFGQRSSVGRTLAVLHPFAQTALTGADTIITRRIWKGGRAPIEQVVQQDGTIRTQLRGGYTAEGIFGEGGWGRELNGKMLAALGTMGVGSALAGLAAVQGFIDSDEDFGEDQFGDIIRPTTLMRSYMLPASGGSSPVAVPVQPGYIGAMHAFGTAAVLYSNDNFDKVEVTRALRDALVYNLTPLNSALGTEMGIADLTNQVIPTLFQPMVQAAANTNSFGSQIYSENRAGEARGVSELTPRTSTPQTYIDVAQSIREIGEAVGVDVDPSPELVRHYLTSYTGGIGQNVDRALKAAHANLQGDPDPEGQRWMEVAGVTPSDPKYAHLNRYYDLVEKHVTPIIDTEKRRAYNEDFLRGAVESDWTIKSKASGAALDAYFDRYGGRQNVRSLSQVIGRVQKAAGKYKKDIYRATVNGNQDEVQRLKDELVTLYRTSSESLSVYLEVAGINS